MGCSYYANAVAGVRLSDLQPRAEKRKSTVVRYDTVTGKPYDLEVETTHTILCGKEFDGDLRKVLSMLGEDYESEDDNWSNPFGEIHPELFSLNYISDIRDDKLINDVVIGFEIASVSDWGDSIDDWSSEHAREQVEKMTHWLSSVFGQVNTPVRNLLVMRVSC